MGSLGAPRRALVVAAFRGAFRAAPARQTMRDLAYDEQLSPPRPHRGRTEV